MQQIHRALLPSSVVSRLIVFMPINTDTLCAVERAARLESSTIELGHLLPQDVFTDLARNRERERTQEVHIARYFVVCDLFLAERSDLFGGRIQTGPQNDAGAELFAVLRVRHADALH